MASHSAGKKKAVKKKAAPHSAGKKKKAVKKKASAATKAIAPIDIPVTTTRGMPAPEPAALPAATVKVAPADLIIEECGDGKRCKQKTNGSFIRQNFISGRWVQVGGTTFPSLQACKDVCEG